MSINYACAMAKEESVKGEKTRSRIRKHLNKLGNGTKLP